MFKLVSFPLSENDDRVNAFGLNPFAIIYTEFNQVLKFLSFEEIQEAKVKGLNLFKKVNQEDLIAILKLA